MSGDLPAKVRAQLTLAYAFGVIGVLSSAYVYWDEQKNIKEIKEKYSDNLTVDSISIKKGSGMTGTKIDKYGLKIEGISSTIYMGIDGIHVLSNVKDNNGNTVLSSTHMTSYEFSAKSGKDEDIAEIGTSGISLKKKMYSGDFSAARMGLVGDVNSFAMGFSASIEGEDKDGNLNIKKGATISPSTVSIYDGKHTRASMGVQTLSNSSTGSLETTSPSTIILFDKDGKVLYRLPAY